MNQTVLLDAAYAIALSSPRDAHHASALELAEQMAAAETQMVTTRAVLLEIGNALAKRQFRSAAVRLLMAVEADPTIEVVPLSEPLYASAISLYRQRRDKEWGLTDCVSFIVMRERALVEALTPDDHFRQAGFHALLNRTAT